MTHTFYHWPDRTIGKRESRRIRDEHNATVNALYESEERIRRAVEQIEDAIHNHRCPETPEGDALRIALGILLGSATEATA